MSSPSAQVSGRSDVARSTKHATVVHAIRRAIADGDWGPGERMPARPEMEALYSVTNMTIQRAVDQLKQEGFLHSRGRWGLYVAERPPCVHRFGLVLPHYPDSDRDPRAQSLCDAAAAAGLWGDDEFCIYPDVVWPTERQRPNATYAHLLADMSELRLAGLVFSRAVFDLATTPLLADDALPRVALASGIWGDRVSAVRTDQEGFTDRALACLAAQGCRRVALLQPAHPGDLPIAAFSAAAARHGLETRPAWIHGVAPALPQWASSTVQLLCSLPAAQRPDGLIVADDHLLPHVTAGLLASGIRLPDQLRVVAHANFPCREATALPVTRLGFDAVEVLRACLQVLKTPGPQHVQIPARFAAEITSPSLHDLRLHAASP